MIVNWTLRWPFVAISCLIVIALFVFIAWRLVHTTMKLDIFDNEQIVWDTDDDLAGEIAQRRYKQYKTLKRTAVALLLAMSILVSLLVARPSTIDQHAGNTATRDIILCLDVSGSTLPYDKAVIDTYLSLVNHFKGERIGLSIFNSTSRTVFPLTDDYSVVKQELQKASTILSGVVDQDSIDKLSDKQYQAVANWLDGTQNREQSTSLIGDGLISCAAMLPQFTQSLDSTAQPTTQSRSASIVFATDNVLSGKPTYQLNEALDLTQQAGIAVDGLFSGAVESQEDQTTLDMKHDIESHHGLFLTHDGSQNTSDAVSSLIRQISERRGYQDDTTASADLVDAPGPFVVALMLVCIGFTVIVWRLRR